MNTGGNGNGTGNGTSRNVPDAIAPGIITSNSCAVGISGGGSAPWWSAVLGLTTESSACAKRETIKLLIAMNKLNEAKQLGCEDDMQFRNAMALANSPCEIDKRRYRQEGLIELTDGTWVKPR